MPSGGNAKITMDILAKIIGYLQSLNKLRAELDKILPGSKIGKNLVKQFKQALSLYKSLSKNLNPKMSSDSQIENYIDKYNHLGEVLQQIAQKMQEVTGEDLKFLSFGDGLKTLLQNLNTAKQALLSSLDTGFKNAINSSGTLSKIFKRLKIDISGKSRVEILLELKKKSEEAGKNIQGLLEKLNKANQVLAGKTAKVDMLKGNPLFDQATFEQKVKDLRYAPAFNLLKKRMQAGMSSLFGANSKLNSNEIILNFLGGLTPLNIYQRINALRETLTTQLGNTVSAKDIYSAIFGDFGNSDNSIVVLTNIVRGLFKNITPESIRPYLTSFVESMSGLLTQTQKGILNNLISTDEIDKLFEKLIEYAPSAAIKLRGALTDAIKLQGLAQTKVDDIEALKKTAEGEQAKIDQTYKTLLNKIFRLEKENQDKEQKIKALQEDIRILKEKAATEVKSNASNAGQGAQEAKLGLPLMKKYEDLLDQIHAKLQMVGKIQGVVQRWFSIYAAVRMVSNAVKEVISTIKLLDKTITEIAIVTNMGQDDLWGQMDKYTDLATQYAASISGVYKVSQLYYQQGLQTNDVMALTELTLKMARISGLLYSEATDFMTNAVRSFKMEMTDAQVVVDTYAAVAASSATSVSELATAMSKTASSAQAVGSSFQNTTAMMAVMIEATRLAPENIGSAMKSIISRYGEMKLDPAKLVDSEGEELSLNKVDKALKSVGITIKNVQGEFRDFDDVIMELAASWDNIDVNTQRYIATVMAGNRQQSRFLALVSSYERLKELSETAADSEDAAQMQYLKTLDSIDAKTQQLQTSIQSLYVDTGLLNWYKGILDLGTNFINMLNNLGTVAKFPAAAIVTIGTAFYNLAHIVTNVFAIIKTNLHARSTLLDVILRGQAQTTGASIVTTLQNTQSQINASMDAALEKYITNQHARETAVNQASDAIIASYLRENQALNGGSVSSGGKLKALLGNKTALSVGLSAAGLLTSVIGSNIKNRQVQGGFNVASSALSGASMGAMVGHPIVGALLGAATGLISNIGNLFQSAETKLKDLKEQALQDSNDALTKKAEVKDLNKQIEALRKLEAARYDSTLAELTYYEAANKLAAEYPNLVSAIDMAGNATINLTAAEQQLATVRQLSIEAAIKAAKSSVLVSLENVHILANKRNTLRDDIYNKFFFEFQNDISRDDRLRELISNNLKSKNYTVEEVEKIIKDRNSIVGLESLFLKYISPDILHDDKDKLLHLFKYYRNEENKKKILLDTQLSLIFNMLFNQDEEADINELLKKINAIDAEALPDEYKELYNELYSYVEAYGATGNKVLLSKAAKKAGIASVTSAYLIGRQENFLTLLTNSSMSLVDQLYSQFLANESIENYDSFINNLQGYLEDEIIKINNVWNDLLPSDKNNINSLIKNVKNYNRTEFLKALGKYLTQGTELFNIIVDSYFGENVNTYTSEEFNAAIQKRNEARAPGKKLKENFDNINNLGETQLQGLLVIWDSVARAYDSNKITLDQANSFLTEYDKILGDIQGNTALSPETKTAATKLVANWNDFSIAGLVKLSDELKDLGIVDDKVIGKIKSLKNYISVNLTTEFNTFTNNVVLQLDDFDKAMSNAVKGMDPKAAIQMANKLGLTLADFNFKDGKYYFKETGEVKGKYLQYKDELKQDLEDYVNSLIGDEGVLTKARGGFDEVGKNFTKFVKKEDFVKFYSKNTEYNEEEAAKLWDIYNNYWEDFNNQLGTPDEETNFGKYVEEQIGDLKENYLSIIEKYGEYTANSLLLTSGQISEFVKAIVGSSATSELQQKIIDAIASGDFSKIPNEFKNLFLEYYSVIEDTFSNVNKLIFLKIIAPIGSTVKIAVTPKNEEALKKLADKLSFITIVLDANGAIYAYFESSISSLLLFRDYLVNNKDIVSFLLRRNLLDSAFNELNVSFSDAYNGITKDVSDISRSDLSNFAKAINSTWAVEDLLNDPYWENIIEFNDKTKKYYVKDIAEFVNKVYDEVRDGHLTDDEAEKYVGQMRTSLYLKSKEYKIRDIIKNYDKLSELQVEMLLNTFHIARSQLHQNADHTYSISLAQIKRLIDTNRQLISGEVEDLIYETIDAMLSNASTATNLLSLGTTSVKSAQLFVTNYKTLLLQVGMGELAQGKTLQDLFDYDEILGGLKLTSEAYSNYVKAQVFILTQAGYTDLEISKILYKNTQRTLYEAIDISGYIDSARTAADKDKLRKSLTDAYGRFFETIELLDAYIDDIITSLDNGGAGAVSMLKFFALKTGKTLTQNDILNAYYRDYSDIVNAINGSVGTVITQTAADFLKGIEGYKIDESTGIPVISAVGDVSAAWRAYHSVLTNSAHKTEDILEAATQTLLTTYGDRGAAETIGKAASMSTSDLLSLFEQLGLADIYSLTVESWIKAGWAEIVNGQVRILDLNILAKYFGWDTNSEEYLEGLKSYRTAMLDVNNKIKSGVESLVEQLNELFIGDQFDLTYLTSLLSKISFDTFEVGTVKNALEELGFKLALYGAYIENGILNITGTNTLGVLDTLKNTISQRLNSGLNKGKYAELIFKINDSINTILSNAVNTFSNYTGGNLTVTGETANILASANKEWAEQLTINGQIVLKGALEFVDAASIVYSTVLNSFKLGYSSLQLVNNSYSSLIKNGLINDTSTITALSNGMSLTVDTLNNFFTSQSKLLEEFLDINGDVKPQSGYLKRIGYDAYQITDWDAFVAQFGGTINKFSKLYIEAYTSYLSTNASNTKDAAISSVIPNLDKITFDQIKTIALSFGTTVEEVMKYLTDNGDGTYKATNGQFLSTLLASAGYKSLNLLPSYLGNLYSLQLNNTTSTFISAINTWASSDYKKSGNLYADFAKAYELFFNGILRFEILITNSALISLESLMNTIENGGIGAVNLMTSIASISGLTLNLNDIKSLYRGKTDKYLSALSNLVTSPGQIIDSYTALILNAASAGSAAMISEGQYVVTSVVNLYDAYLQALKKLTSSGGATLGLINSAAAKVLGSRDGLQAIIEAVSSASSMTWDTFADMMTQAGISLVDASGEINEEFIEALTNSLTGIIEQLGGDKIRIKDFETFAAFMGWDANSELYISAFKSYNDAMVALNQKTENDITLELQNVASAKPGDYINLTSFYTALGKLTVDFMNDALVQAGAFLDHGILKLGSDFRVLDTINILSTFARNYGIDESLIASLYDAINDSINTYISDIKAALTGSASNSQMFNIKSFSEQLGLSGIDLSFTLTANGLKLSKLSAIELYQALSQIDSQTASLMFEDLATSLTLAGSGLLNISATTAKIATIKRQIDEAHTLGREALAAVLREQLSLYLQIAAYQRKGADSYSFMDNKLPLYLQGPKNYWESVRKAYKAINEAAKGVLIEGGTKKASSGGKKSKGTDIESALKRYLMEVEDYYNIVTELGNLAQITGTDLVFLGQTIAKDGSTTAALILKGLSALTNIDGESTKIDLGKIGFNIETGAADMKGGFDAALKDMAQSQIDMIDGLINVLEVVVQMLQLGKVDVGDNGVIDLGEIFPEIEGRPGEYDYTRYTKPFMDFSKQIIDLASKEENKNLNEALNKIKLGNQTLFKILEDAKNGIVSADLDPQAFQRLMNSLYQMYLSDNYDLNNLIDSIANLGFLGEITVGLTTLLVRNGITLQSDKDGVYTIGGKQTKDAAEAIKLATLQREAGLKLLIDAAGNKQYTEKEDGSVLVNKEIGSIKYTVHVDKEGETTFFTENGGPYKTLAQVYDAQWKSDIAKGTFSEELSYDAYLVLNGIVKYNLFSETKSVSVEQAKHLMLTTAKQLRLDWEAALAEGKEAVAEFQVKYGFRLDEKGVADGLTDESLKKLIEGQILPKTIKVNTYLGEGAWIMLILKEREVTINATLKLEAEAAAAEAAKLAELKAAKLAALAAAKAALQMSESGLEAGNGIIESADDAKDAIISAAQKFAEIATSWFKGTGGSGGNADNPPSANGNPPANGGVNWDEEGDYANSIRDANSVRNANLAEEAMAARQKAIDDAIQYEKKKARSDALAVLESLLINTQQYLSDRQAKNAVLSELKEYYNQGQQFFDEINTLYLTLPQGSTFQTSSFSSHQSAQEAMEKLEEALAKAKNGTLDLALEAFQEAAEALLQFSQSKETIQKQSNQFNEVRQKGELFKNKVNNPPEGAGPEYWKQLKDEIQRLGQEAFNGLNEYIELYSHIAKSEEAAREAAREAEARTKELNALNDLKEQYDKAVTKEEKFDLAKQIVDVIKNSTYLEEDENHWEKLVSRLEDEINNERILSEMYLYALSAGEKGTLLYANALQEFFEGVIEPYNDFTQEQKDEISALILSLFKDLKLKQIQSDLESIPANLKASVHEAAEAAVEAATALLTLAGEYEGNPLINYDVIPGGIIPKKELEPPVPPKPTTRTVTDLPPLAENGLYIILQGSYGGIVGNPVVLGSLSSEEPEHTENPPTDDGQSYSDFFDGMGLSNLYNTKFAETSEELNKVGNQLEEALAQLLEAQLVLASYQQMSDLEKLRLYGGDKTQINPETGTSKVLDLLTKAVAEAREKVLELQGIYDGLLASWDLLVLLAAQEDDRNAAILEGLTPPAPESTTPQVTPSEEVLMPLVDTSGYQDAADEIGTAGAEAAALAASAGKEVEDSAAGVSSSANTLKAGLNNLKSAESTLSSMTGGTSGKVSGLSAALDLAKVHVQNFITALQTLSEVSPPSGGGATSAKGNVALAAGTLVGLLGPELAIYGGSYHLLGQNGAEMVNLPSDAIVFNHLQTRQLLNVGSTGRGKPITNLRAAVAFATGTFGPAMASASAALAALHQIRAMWLSMLGASAQDLGSMAGALAGKDSGGGGGGGGDKGGEIKSTTAEIERWYNLTRQIDKLLKDITRQQTLRDKLDSDRLANGKAIYESRKKLLKLLTDQITATRELVYLQKSWYDRKRTLLALSDYGMIFSYNEEGLQQYTSGQNRGLDILEKLTSRDVTGELTGWAVSAEKQLLYLRSIGFNTDILKYNDDGTVIDLKNPGDKKVEDLYVQMMENFWDGIQGWQDLLDSLYDSYNLSYEAILEYLAQRNLLLKEIIDNQLAVLNEIITAIEDREQAVIDGLQDERDAIEDSTQKFIQGLQDQLDREKKMYERNQEEEDLNKLRRQILILQRAGGSASQIGSLQDELASKEKDAYFNAQQETIDAIQKASDKELERLDAQIDLMSDTLEYQKLHGLLWEEVSTIMQQDELQIMQFIADNKEEWAGYSALQEQEERLGTMKQIQDWAAFRDDDQAYWTSALEHSMTVEQSIEGLDDEPWATTDAAMYAIFGDSWSDYADLAKQVFDQILGITGDSAEAQEKALKDIDGTIMVPAGEGTEGGGTGPSGRYGQGDTDREKYYYERWGAYLESGGSADLYDARTGSSGDVWSGSQMLESGGNKDYTDSAWQSDYQRHWKIRKYNDGREEIVKMGLHHEKTKIEVIDGVNNKVRYCTVCNFIKGRLKEGDYGYETFASGGLINYTGMAMVHGSKTLPEAVLNPQQTKFLREDFLRGTSAALTALETIGTRWLSMVENYSNNESIVIEKALVIMNINKMNNDYDARQAGEAALDEMLKVARKSGTRGMSRR